ncbi:MAG: DUF2750 domain-containing protein [Alteromonadaceae bacterium]|nr:DUF2750 domain-containing protein [Alteromonadaceae bacterium]
MTQLTDQQIEDVLKKNPDNRYEYLLDSIKESGEMWILADDVGAVMFNSEDEEDLVPIWPTKQFAELWRSDEWQHCKPIAVTVKKWLADWTPGLEEDEIAIVAFPNQDNEGLILAPYQLHERLE